MPDRNKHHFSGLTEGLKLNTASLPKGDNLEYEYFLRVFLCFFRERCSFVFGTPTVPYLRCLITPTLRKFDVRETKLSNSFRYLHCFCSNSKFSSSITTSPNAIPFWSQWNTRHQYPDWNSTFTDMQMRERFAKNRDVNRTKIHLCQLIADNLSLF